MHRVFYLLFVLFFGLATTTAHTPPTSLPSECFNPSGKSCDWYPNCLEKKYPCEGSSYAYALKFANKFCKLYNTRQSLFSTEEWAWVNAVRKCLQVALAPTLSQSKTPTCKEIRKKGFQSHVPCYLNPDKSVPSICNLGCDVYIKVFAVVKGSLTDFNTAWEMLKAMWQISRKCGFKCSLTDLREKRHFVS